MTAGILPKTRNVCVQAFKGRLRTAHIAESSEPHVATRTLKRVLRKSLGLDRHRRSERLGTGMPCMKRYATSADRSVLIICRIAPLGRVARVVAGLRPTAQRSNRDSRLERVIGQRRLQSLRLITRTRIQVSSSTLTAARYSQITGSIKSE
jgi:hypothetical protein